MEFTNNPQHLFSYTKRTALLCRYCKAVQMLHSFAYSWLPSNIGVFIGF
jgi:hypothetical protein